MEINVGEYVRTKYGIAKYIKDINTKITIYKMLDKKIVWDNVEDWEDIISNSDITKHSKDIIDLIEVGDYVNGIEIVEIYTSARDNLRHQGVMKKDINFEITSILTHEQFEANAYVLEKEV